jgi:hypothetical protein
LEHYGAGPEKMCQLWENHDMHMAVHQQFVAARKAEWLAQSRHEWDNQDMKTDINLTAENVLRADRELRRVLGREPSVAEVARFLDGEQDEKSLYVQVQFDRGGTYYTYRTSTPVKVGSYVVVPPPHLGQEPRMLKVARKGLPTHMRGSYIKPAQTVAPWVQDAQLARDLAQRSPYGEDF